MSRPECPLGCPPDRAVEQHAAPHPWILRRCAEHDLVWLVNPPELEALREEFAWERTSALEARRRSDAEPVIHSVSRPIKHFRSKILRRRKVRDLALAHIARSGRPRLLLVDVGCGRGNLLLEIMTWVESPGRVIPVGIEISSELAGISQRKLEPFGGEILPLDAEAALETFEDQSIDIITMASYLEHEIRPLEILTLCRRKLAQDGIIVLKVPNYDSWNRRMRGNRWCGYRFPDHVNYFGADSLSKTAQLAGLEVARMKWLDRFPLSDSLYAVLRRPPHAAE